MLFKNRPSVLTQAFQAITDGQHRGNYFKAGDWIVTKGNGDICICSNEVFTQIFERATPEDVAHVKNKTSQLCHSS